ncbi:MAG: hypothetical protein JWQ00_2594 [Noviherbaspirillum sp.]|nr:hypothetical protein [Noviherbaspirillum sp.]
MLLKTGMARACALTLCAASIMTAAPAPAQNLAEFPGKPVKLIVTYSPGGAFDFIGRQLAKGLQDIWGQPVVVENKPGASGSIGAEFVARSKPDGLTLLVGSAGPIVVVPFMRDKLPYDPLKDLKPIAMTAGIPNVLVVNADSPYKTFTEFIGAAKKHPKEIDYASSGRGDSHHMTMEHMMRATGVQLNEIPYKGGAPALLAVQTGEVPAAWLAVSTALPLIQSGKLRALAVSTQERVSHLPDVRTVAELGYRDFEVIYWIGIMGPAGMPPALVQKIQNDLKTVVDTKEYRDSIVRTGGMLRFGGADQFTKIIHMDYQRNKALLSQ